MQLLLEMCLLLVRKYIEKHGTEHVPHSIVTRQQAAIDGPLSKYNQFDKRLIKVTTVKN